jgi:hypothetical protein
MVATFKESYKNGLLAEKAFENYFKNLIIQNVQDKKEYRDIDIDYLCKNGTYEVKINLIDFEKGIKERGFRIEIGDTEGKSVGWWHKSKADFFCFFDYLCKDFIVIRNSQKFREYINQKIKSECHDSNSYYRYDYTKDYRYNGIITMVTMRVYLSELKRNGFVVRKSITT